MAVENVVFFSKRIIVIELPVSSTKTVQSFIGLAPMVPEIIWG